MTKRWLGLSASKECITFVEVEVPDDDSPLVIVSDDTWRVQKGDRAEAYGVLYRQCFDYIRERQIDAVYVQASAVAGKGAARLGMLEGAEVRGVGIAAASAASSVFLVKKSVISRTYGERKVGEYVEDDDFWDKHTTGGRLRKGSREVTMLLIAARNI